MSARSVKGLPMRAMGRLRVAAVDEGGLLMGIGNVGTHLGEEVQQIEDPEVRVVARTVGGAASVSAGAVAARINRAPRSLPATQREVNAVVKRKYGHLLPQITATEGRHQALATKMVPSALVSTRTQAAGIISGLLTCKSKVHSHSPARKRRLSQIQTRQPQTPLPTICHTRLRRFSS